MLGPLADASVEHEIRTAQAASVLFFASLVAGFASAFLRDRLRRANFFIRFLIAEILPWSSDCRESARFNTTLFSPQVSLRCKRLVKTWSRGDGPPLHHQERKLPHLSRFSKGRFALTTTLEESGCPLLECLTFVRAEFVFCVARSLVHLFRAARIGLSSCPMLEASLGHESSKSSALTPSSSLDRGTLRDLSFTFGACPRQLILPVD